MEQNSGKKFGFCILLFALIMAAFTLHCYKTREDNAKDWVYQAGDSDADVFATFGLRGRTTDAWEKQIKKDGKTINLQAAVYDLSVVNRSKSNVDDWSLELDIVNPCAINNAWSGTVEIIQHRGITMSQELDLQNFNMREITLDHTYCDPDILIWLKPGDKIIYHPSTLMQEVPIEYNADYDGIANCGMIFYTNNAKMDVRKFRIQYSLKKSYFQGAIGELFILLFALWGVYFFILVIAEYSHAQYEQKLKKNEEILNETLAVFCKFVDAKDPYTQGHSNRVAVYSKLIAQALGLSEQECKNVYYVALLHDIGKCYVPDEILKKTSSLTKEEFAIIKTHTTKGAELLSDFTSIPRTDMTAGAMYHHERYDGTGYPQGKKGMNIPLIGRIICVADSYDAMSSDRYYRSRLSREARVRELKKNSGTQFDPRIVAVFLNLMETGKIRETI